MQFLREFSDLQDGKEIVYPHSGIRASLPPLELFTTSSMLVAAPACFAFVFLMLAALAVTNAG